MEPVLYEIMNRFYMNLYEQPKINVNVLFCL